jgi:hypothetical protein
MAMVVLLFVSIVGALAAGCGGWDPPDLPPPETPATAAPVPGARAKTPGSAPSARRPAPGAARDLRAGDFLLEPGPETSGLAVSRSDRSDYSEFPEKEFAECLGVPAEKVRDRSEQTAFGRMFSDDLTGLSLSSTAMIVPADALRSDLTVIARTEYPGCVAEFAGDALLQQAIADLGEGSGIAVDVLHAEAVPPPPGASSQINLVLSTKTADGDVSELYYYDVVSVYRGRVEATIHANGHDPLDGEVLAAATAQVAEKARHQ